LIDNFKQREAEMNSDTFSQNESASQSEDRRAGKYELLKAGDEPFCPRRINIPEQIRYYKENTLVAPGQSL
jgi:hypothetical protein